MLITITGDVGSGKTLLATALAMADSRNIYANYIIKKDNAKLIEPQDLWEISNGLVIIDEAYSWAESRTSGKNINRYLSYIVFQSRKMHIDIISIVQLFSTEDKRIREMSELIILAEKKKDHFSYTILRQSLTNPWQKKIKIPFSVASFFYDKYDTYARQEIPYDLIGDAILDKRKILPEVKRIANELLLISDSKWTLSAVRSHVLDNGYPKSYAQAIYDEIQRKKIGD